MSFKFIFFCATLGLTLASPSQAQKHYDPGASDTEIKFGQTLPYSGPASAYGIMGKVEAAYFKMVNENGGINGRKLNFISLDDGYSPPKTVEMTRRLVEQDQVLFIMHSLGTPTNAAIHRYMNTKKVPHLFLATGASKWNDPKNFPWTVAFNPSYHAEGKLYAQEILRSRPNAKIAVLMQNDDYGKDIFNGFSEGLGSKAKSMIVGQATYEVTDPTIDSQIVTLQATGADTFVNFSLPKFAAQAIRKVAEIGWQPVHYINSVSSSIASVLTPAGLEKSVGIISMQYIKDVNSPQFASDPAMKDYFAFMKKYAPELNPNESLSATAVSVAQLMVHVLKQCGDDLSRDNIMRQVTNLKDFQIPMARPGVFVNATPDDYSIFKTMQIVQFDGKTWVSSGQPVQIQ